MCTIITGTSKGNQKWRWDVSCKEAVKVDVVDGNKMIPLRFLRRHVARDAVHSTAKSICIVYQVCYIEYLCNELYRSTFLGDLLWEFVRNSGYLSHKLSITEGRRYLYLLEGADLEVCGGGYHFALLAVLKNVPDLGLTFRLQPLLLLLVGTLYHLLHDFLTQHTIWSRKRQFNTVADNCQIGATTE